MTVKTGEAGGGKVGVRGESKAARGGKRRGDETKGATDSEWTGQGSVRQGVEPQRNARRSIRDADIEAGSVRWMNAGSW